MGRVARFGALAAVIAALLLAIATTPARADGDPASDVLIAGRVFVGFGSPTSTPEVRELLELTAEARRKGLPIRVAVIREITDLGAVPTLFGLAQRYATFLRQELRFVCLRNTRRRDGRDAGRCRCLRARRHTSRELGTKGIAVPVAGDAGAVAVIASTAIRRVAAANGHTLTAPHVTAAHAPSHVLAIAIAGVLAGIAVALTAGLLNASASPLEKSGEARCEAVAPVRQLRCVGALAAEDGVRGSWRRPAELGRRDPPNATLDPGRFEDRLGELGPCAVALCCEMPDAWRAIRRSTSSRVARREMPDVGRRASAGRRRPQSSRRSAPSRHGSDKLWPVSANSHELRTIHASAPTTASEPSLERPYADSGFGASDSTYGRLLSVRRRSHRSETKRNAREQPARRHPPSHPR